jgi:hypothetical protein
MSTTPTATSSASVAVRPQANKPMKLTVACGARSLSARR